MFKSLFATCLLLFGCSNDIVKGSDNPHDSVGYCANNLTDNLSIPVYAESGSVTLNGAYCFIDDFEDLRDFYLPPTEEDFDFVYYDDMQHLSEEPYVKCFFAPTQDTMNYVRVDKLEISSNTYGTRTAVTCFIDLPDGNVVEVIRGLDGSMAGYTSIAQSVILYFQTPVQITMDAYRIFSLYFSHNQNSHCVAYNGYYTIVDLTASSSTYSFEIMGMMCANNDIFQFMYYNGQELNPLTDSSGKIVQDNYVLINGTLINSTMYSNMQRVGVFAYVRQTQSYEFKDLFVEIADTPVRFLTDLFSFELFGVEVAVAFMSIVTLLLIILVLKKIV